MKRSALGRATGAAALLLIAGCCPPEVSGRGVRGTVQPDDPPQAASSGDEVAAVLKGRVSYYHDSLAGNRTANGEVYDPKKLTAASRTLPFGTRVRVTNARNGRSVVVRINDRGPFIKGRTIDLSRRAAEELGIIRRGHARVEMELIAP